MIFMKITGIKRQKNGRFAVYIDGEYVLSLNSKLLSEFCLDTGGEISCDQLEKIKCRANEMEADNRAMTILTYRDHSKEELRRKLSRTFDGECAQKAADHMEELGLVNDAMYAERLAYELLEKRFMSESRALFEMVRRGINREIAEDAIEKTQSDPVGRIASFLAKKYPGWKENEKIRRRALTALNRNGFKWDDIRRAIDD